MEIVQALIEANVYVNAGDEYGYTALMRSTKYGYTDIVALLKI